MNRLIKLLNASTRPMILLGAGARDSVSDVITFAERWQIPMETTWNAVDLVPYDHPLFVGRPGIIATRGSNWAIQDCDLLLAIGARLDQPTIAYDYYKFAPFAKKVLVDVDEGERLKIPNLDLFYHMDVGEFIHEALKYTPLGYPKSWLKKCFGYKQYRLEGNDETLGFMDFLCDYLPNDAIIVMNSGCQAINIFCAGFRNKAGQRFIQTSCGLGSMGGAISVGIGAALASGKPVTVIDGDGSFMQNIQELEVIRRLNLPITIYVLKNGGYASIHNSEMRMFGRSKKLETLPNIKNIAISLGVKVIIIETPLEEQIIPRVMFDGRGDLSNMFPYEDE